MAIVRSFSNGFEVVDWTEEVNFIPNNWGTINQLGLFQDVPVAEHTVTFEEIRKDGALIVDHVRGDRASVGKDATRKLHTFAVPHFPYDDYISPQDIQGKRAYGAAGDAETLDAVRARKMERIRQNHAWTLEFARAQAITQGTAYAPNGTVVQDWNAEFGVTRLVIDATLGTSTAEPIASIEQGIAALQDNANGEIITGVVVLTSPEFFGKLIKHPAVKTAYQYYSSTQSPLRDRLAGTGFNGQSTSMAMHREFDYAGVRFIEMRDTYAGQRLIPANNAYMIPLGTTAFRTFYSPANRFGLVNTLGEQVYMFESMDQKGTQIDIDTEANHISALLKPQLVVTLVTSN